MGKNAHAPRGQKITKKSDAVVGSSNPTPDGAGVGGKGEKNKSRSTRIEDAQPSALQEPKKPDTRTLIGGASWTGKLPVNMLSEHCQKQKWEKPEYTMLKTPEGYSSMVILKNKDPKTQELTTLPPLKLQPAYKHLAFQPTAVEARHFAAAYALFRVCSMRNIHMMMPPTYRDLWKGPFQEMKVEDQTAGMAWKYDADPFITHSERERAAQKKAIALEHTATAKKQDDSTPGATDNKASKKGWSTAAKVEMGIKIRREVEDLARNYSIWNPLHLQIPEDSQREIIQHLSGRGFRQSHVEEAVNICKDLEETIEWLLVHVPEDDLPKWSLPEGYVAGVSLASGDLKKDAAVKRLASGGYSTETCRYFYDVYHGNERKAAQNLQNNLLGFDSVFDDQVTAPESNELDPWIEEQDILASIYGKKYDTTDPTSFLVKVEVLGVEGEIACGFSKPCGPYPTLPPILSINAKLPSYIRLSITKQALEYCIHNLVGEQMIFNLVDWLEREIPGIVSNPGPLSTILSSASQGSVERERLQDSRKPTSKKQTASETKKYKGNDTSNRMLLEWRDRQETKQQQKMQETRQALPAWNLREDIINAINKFQVVVISGETGSGKSTQTVQFILDDMIQNGLGDLANIICTQPRRISAMSLADRVSQERCTALGKEVGYAIRGESKQSADATKVMFVTTGVLLRRLQTAGGSMNEVMNSLSNISHIVVDEIHERTLDTDFLLALLRDAIRVRKDLKLILMSATLDANTFEKYFGGPETVAKVEIQGRMFPVHDLYIDDAVRMTGFRNHDENEGDGADEETTKRSPRHLGIGINYDLITCLVEQIDQDLGSTSGGILIFLPGTGEIQKVLNKLQDLSYIYALPLHASLLPAEQRRVFPPAPAGKRKVIASTNVAETSITIDDIVAVIDTGRVKETRYEPKSNMVKLEEVWASRVACQQRRGRAGRVRAGTCYKLFTRNAESKMADRPDPEIRRVPLEQLCLSVKAMGINGVSKFLSQTLTPPEETAVEGALDLLHKVGALDGEHLSSLGHHLSMIPADLRCAKLMVYGALFDYLEECVLIASILSAKSPFVSPQDKRDEAKKARSYFANGQGDLIADLHAYQEWTNLRHEKTTKEIRAWCQDNFLSQNTLWDISSNRTQYLTTLKEIGMIPLDYRSPLKPKQISYAFLDSLILSALYPQTLRISLPSQKYQSTVSGALPVDPESREIKYFESGNERVFVHPSSTMFSAQSFPNNATFLSYFKKIETSKVFANDLTPCGSYGVMLFGGPIELDTQGRGVVVDSWIRLRGWPRIGMLISRLRVILDRVLTNWIDNPGFGSRGEMEDKLVRVVKKLIELEGMDA